MPRELSVNEILGAGRSAFLPHKTELTAKLQISYYAKYVDEHTKNQLKTILIAFDRSLLVADPRRCEPKKFGGKGARSRFQKSYR